MSREIREKKRAGWNNPVRRIRQEKVWLTLCLWAGLAGVLLCNTMTVLRGSVAAFHSDSATAILLAREQMYTGQLIPEGWHYANDIWMLSLNLLCIPFMLFIKDWMLCRELAVIVQMLLATWALVAFVKKLAGIRGALAAALLFWCPLSAVVREHFLYQATYATGMLQTLLVLLAAYGFFLSQEKKRILLYGGLLGAVTVIMAAAGIRFIGTTVLPILGAIGLLLLFDTDFDLRRFREKQYALVVGKMAWFLLMSGVGYWLHLRLRAGGAISEFGMQFITETGIWSKLDTLLQYYLSIWGCMEAVSVFSFTGILSFCCFVLCIVMNVVVPVYLIVRYRKFESRGIRFFILYALLTGIALNYLVVFTNLYNNYYLLPCYFNACILSALALLDLFRYKKNISVFLTTICLIPFCLVVSLYWGSRDYGKGEADYALLEVLKENSLYFGGSGIFWDTYKYSVLSNGEVEIVSFTDTPENPNLWLSAERWYQPEYYEGKSFILVRGGWQDIPDEWKAYAEEMIPFGEFFIYVYPENIYKIAEEKKGS